MKIIVLNCGSSSIKFQFYDTTKNIVMAKGTLEKLGLHGSFLKYEKCGESKVTFEGEILDHQMGIEYILGVLLSSKHGIIKSFDEIDAVGHRVVLGGEEFDRSVLINDYVLQKVESFNDLAPLHNPANLKGIYAMQYLLQDIPQVATFDTAFHQTMEEKVYMYALPYSMYKNYGIRRYGFHGTSHRYVSQRACEVLDLEYSKQRIITCHLGNGASIAAIKYGKSIDTSMGLTPVEGLIMGTRCGDIDAGVLSYIMQQEQIDSVALNSLLNKHSGMLGISGVSSDMREIMEASGQGNERAKLSIEMYTYRIKKYIGSYAAAMGGVDILVFTGGVGENAGEIRKQVCSDMEYMGIVLDDAININTFSSDTIISPADKKVKVMVIATNEELVIAKDTEQIVKNIQQGRKLEQPFNLDM